MDSLKQSTSTWLTIHPDMHKSIRVRILGRDYPLRINVEDEITMRSVAQMVEQRMQAFKKQHPAQTDLVVAVITALGLAEELLLTKDSAGKVLEMVDQEVIRMNKVLGSALQSTEP